MSSPLAAVGKKLHKKKEKKEKKSKKERRSHKQEKEGKRKSSRRIRGEKSDPVQEEEEDDDGWVVRTPPPAVSEGQGEEDASGLLRTPPRQAEDTLSEALRNAASEREAAGMSWMLRPPSRRATRTATPAERPPSPPAKPKARELNPYFAEGGTGLPPEEEERHRRLPPSYAVGDGGRGWRARANNRAREQMEGEGTTSEQDHRAIPSSGEGRRWRKQLRETVSDDRKRGHDGHHETSQENEANYAFRPKARQSVRSFDPREEIGQASAETGLPMAISPTPTPPSDSINKLEAQLLKAEMIGDEKRMSELKAKIAQLHQAQKVVVLSGLDHRDRPVNQPALTNLDEARRMAAAERELDSTSSNLDFVRSLARHRGYIGEDFGEVNLDEEGRKKKRRRTGPQQTQEDLLRHRAVAGEALDQRIREGCVHCLDEGKRVGKHLLISVGEKAYLCLPHRGALVPDHCLIVPLAHAPASTAVESDVYEEIANFQRALQRMSEQQGKAVIFFEAAGTGKRAKHMVIHCVPMAKRDAAVAPGYFKKTLSEVESDWGQHRKIINTTGKGVRRSIPKDFPYFHVQFPDGTSFGHVIEETKSFPLNLGKEVIAGILELPPEAIRGQQESYEAQRARAQAFQHNWRPFDFTKRVQ